MGIGVAELALVVVQYLENQGCHQAAQVFRREAQERICPLPAVYHQLRKLESIVDEYVLLKHQRDRLQALSAEHPVLGSIITTLNLHACSAALAITPVAPPAAQRDQPTDDAPSASMPRKHHSPGKHHSPPPPAAQARPPAHPPAAASAANVREHVAAAGTPKRPVRRGRRAADIESTGKTPLDMVEEVYTVRKDRKRSREAPAAASHQPAQGGSRVVRKALRYEGSQQQDTNMPPESSKGTKSMPSPAPRPQAPTQSPAASPPPAPIPQPRHDAAAPTGFAGNAVIRVLQQQHVVGQDAAAAANAAAAAAALVTTRGGSIPQHPHQPQHHAILHDPAGLLLDGGETIGGLTNMFAGDSLFGIPMMDGDGAQHPTNHGGDGHAAGGGAAHAGGLAAPAVVHAGNRVMGNKENMVQQHHAGAMHVNGMPHAQQGGGIPAHGQQRKASKAAIEAFLGTINAP